MKHFILLFSVFALACGSSKPVMEELDQTVMETIDPVSQLSKDFARAVIQNEADHIRSYYVTPNVARVLIGEKVRTWTDQQLKDTFVNPMTSRFEANLMKLQNEMKSANIDASTLRYQGYEEDEHDPAAMSHPVVVQLESKGVIYSIPISYMKVSDKVYVHEILMTTGLF